MIESLFSLTMNDVVDGAVISEPAGTVSISHAQQPDRSYDIHSHGVRITVYEWGSVNDPVLMLVHGGLDFARTYDVFAPLLVSAGWRVVSWDHRCHGNSEWAAMGNWSSDLRDAVSVLDLVAPASHGPVPIVGHSKGGAMALRLAEAMPHRFAKVVNIDGIPSNSPQPDVVDAMRTRLAGGDLAGWLDHRQAAGTKERRPDTLEGLAQRRARMNPRLDHRWLCYLVTVGARRDADGWRWKIDPMLRPGGFGPWRPEWALEGMAQLSMPLLAILCEDQEPMGWGTRPRHVTKYLPVKSEMIVASTGHFVHIEQPGWTAGKVTEFLGSPA